MLNMATIEKKQHIPIFVSSTFEDMKTYRDSVAQSISSLEHVAKGMELFGSSPETPLDKCLSEVRKSSLFICLIGMRYGSTDEEKGRSFTYLEYEEAIKNNIPVLAYILSEDAPVIAKYVDKDENAKLLVEFKKVLTSRHMVSYFDSPADLKAKATRDIVVALEKMNDIKIFNDQLMTEEESPVEVVKKFMQRPKKYSGKEVELSVKIANNCGYFYMDDFIYNIGLTQGDVVGTKVMILDESEKEISDDNYLYLYTDGELADSLEKHAIGDILKIRTKLLYIGYKKIEEYDGGKRLIQVNVKCLMLIKIL